MKNPQKAREKRAKSKAKARKKPAPKPSNSPPKFKLRLPKGAWFDENAANRVVFFIENFCRHSKGEWSGRLFVLEPWQKDIIRTAFGWKNKSGTRVFRKVFVGIPRKNGKSTIAAAIALYLTIGEEGEGAPEVFSAAADKPQAKLVFEEARRMVQADPDLSAHCDCYANAIVRPDTLGSYKVLSADANRKHGLNAHGVIYDELHAAPSRELYDVLTTSMGARRQPMFLCFTTAGYDRESICYELWQYALKVIDGRIKDPTFLAVIYAADPKDDWRDPATWSKANPNLGVSLKREFLENEVREATESPAKENTFKRLHLNIWTEQAVRWMPMEKWDLCGRPLDWSKVVGQRCFIGLDLSKRSDITAAVQVFKVGDEYWVRPHFFIPEDSISEKERRDGIPVREWIKAGYLTATPGNVVDYSFVQTWLLARARENEIAELAYDPYGAVQLAISLQDEGLNCVEFGQSMKFMSEPTKELLNLTLQGKIQHGGNPVLRWMAANAAAYFDANGNCKLVKNKSTGRIDGVIATIMGLGRAMLEKDQTSAYETSKLVIA